MSFEPAKPMPGTPKRPSLKMTPGTERLMAMAAGFRKAGNASPPRRPGRWCRNAP
jgi:hypothetical protein